MAKLVKLKCRKAKPNSKYWRTRADNAWAKLVRAPGKCVAAEWAARLNIRLDPCSPNLQAHHIIDRSRYGTRWNLENGACLCVNHHKYSRTCSAHKGPLLFMWLMSWADEPRFRKLAKLQETNAELLIGYRQAAEMLEQQLENPYASKT